MAPGESGNFIIDNIQTNNAENIISISVNEVNDLRIQPITSSILIPKPLNVETTVLEAEVSVNYDMIGSTTNWHLRDMTTNTIVHEVTGDRSYYFTTQVNNVPLIDGHCYEFLIEETSGQGFVGTNTAGASITINNQEILSKIDNRYLKRLFTFRFKINGDRLTAIEENTLSSKANVYPNPSQGLVNINLEMAQADLVNIEVINALGQVMHYQNKQALSQGENQIQLQLNDLANGLYFIRIANESRQDLLPFVINK